MTMRLVKAVGAKQYQTKISIQDLLIWAIKRQRVMAWMDSDSDRMGGLASQMGMIVRAAELGATIDRFRSCANTRMPDDAFKVGVAVGSLGVDERRLVIEHAMAGDEPYCPIPKMVYVDARGNEIDLKVGAVVNGITSERVMVDGVLKRVRVKAYCRVKPNYYGNDLRFFVEQYNIWACAVELLAKQLNDLTHYSIDLQSLPKFIV